MEVVGAVEVKIISHLCLGLRNEISSHLTGISIFWVVSPFYVSTAIPREYQIAKQTTRQEKVN
jgi:hypothetical protein